jgi:hypothetical protein
MAELKEELFEANLFWATRGEQLDHAARSCSNVKVKWTY